MKWDGKRLRGSRLAIDTETEYVENPLVIPRIALLTASDGETNCWLPPASVSDFLKVHKGCTFYAYNAPFDFWTINDRLLWDAAGSNRLICLQLLWRLIRLAEGGVAERQGTLADACRTFNVETVNKEDPYRLRYGELLGLEDYETHPEWEGFRDYALKDALATFRLIAPMESLAARIQTENRKGLHKDAVKKWGLLSVCVQTRGAIVLSHLSRQPLRIDMETARRMEAEARQGIEEASQRLEGMCPGIWHRYKKKNDAGYKRTSNGMYQRNEKPLIELLIKKCQEYGKVFLTTPGGEVSTSASQWIKHLPEDTFVQEWSKLELCKKRLTSFLVPLVSSAGVIYAKYEPLLNTGRTSAAKHGKGGVPSINIQQIPKDNTIRKLFLADEGCQRVTSDYSYLELRTLAACCQLLYGKSSLGDAVRKHTADEEAGIKSLDPHEWMGAISLGLPPTAEAWYTLDEKTRKQARQKAKVANFGLPGGLGVKKLIEYAKGYNVTLSLDQAKDLKQTWFTAFPEMQQWLADRTIQNLAKNLGVSSTEVLKRWGKPWQVWNLRNAIEGLMSREEATPYIDTLWRLCRYPALKKTLADFSYLPPAHESLADELLLSQASVPTGLIRGKVGYCDGCNLPFQGLAAAGAKEALWSMLYAGYNLKAFIHDEILCDSPNAERMVPHIQRHMNRAMEGVMQGGIPCRSSSHVAPTWVKQ